MCKKIHKIYIELFSIPNPIFEIKEHYNYKKDVKKLLNKFISFLENNHIYLFRRNKWVEILLFHYSYSLKFEGQWFPYRKAIFSSFYEKEKGKLKIILNNYFKKLKNQEIKLGNELKLVSLFYEALNVVPVICLEINFKPKREHKTIINFDKRKRTVTIKLHNKENGRRSEDFDTKSEKILKDYKINPERLRQILKLLVGYSNKIKEVLETKTKKIKKIYFYNIPTVFVTEKYEDIKKEIPCGGITVITSQKLSSIDKSFLSLLATLFWSRLEPFELVIRELYKIKLHALRSAVAAIMSRNMSHQQGSAVIPYLLSLEGVKDKEKILTQYLSYIESRMDFVATAATMEFPKWGISVKFIKDIMIGFVSQYGLLECLCKSEGYRYDNIQFKVYINNSENLLEKNINIINEKDVNVWIPGGLTGIHAFYLILENIMRNAAKYNKKDSELVVSIKLIEKDDSYIVQVWDNLSSKIEKVTEFNNTFRESLIKPTGEKREYAWGFAEMRICAAFLISGTDKDAAGELSNDEECPINAIEVCERGQKKIGYEFKLKKPKLLEVYDES